MKYCENCGTRMYNNTCSNCSEELYILENQGDFIDFPLSDDFQKKVKIQMQEKKERKIREKFMEREQDSGHCNWDYLRSR